MANLAVHELEYKNAAPPPLVEDIEKRFDQARRRRFELREADVEKAGDTPDKAILHVTAAKPKVQARPNEPKLAEVKAAWISVDKGGI